MGRAGGRGRQPPRPRPVSCALRCLPCKPRVSSPHGVQLGLGRQLSLRSFSQFGLKSSWYTTGPGPQRSWEHRACRHGTGGRGRAPGQPLLRWHPLPPPQGEWSAPVPSLAVLRQPPPQRHARPLATGLPQRPCPTRSTPSIQTPWVVSRAGITSPQMRKRTSSARTRAVLEPQHAAAGAAWKRALASGTPSMAWPHPLQNGCTHAPGAHSTDRKSVV